MKQPRHRPALKELPRDERGAVAILLTLCLPIFVGFLGLTIDMAYAYQMRNMLQVTAEAAALAATAKLFPDPTQAVPAAQQYVEKNMPAARYGSVMANADVVGGWWCDNTKTFGTSSCTPSAGIPVSTCTGITCNAIKVTTKRAGSLFFTSGLGLKSFTVSATAIATFGYAGGTSPPTWDVIVVQDVSYSFQGEIKDARTADQTLLDCMHDYSPSGSRFGLIAFNKTMTELALLKEGDVQAKYNNLTNAITSLSACNSSSCWGTDPALGMQDANTQFTNSPPTVTGSRQAMVIVSDGQPMACTTTTDRWGRSTTTCSPSQQLNNNAIAQADAAAAKGFDVYAIFYNDGSDPTGGADFLRSLVRGKGSYLETPNSSGLKTKMKELCSSQLPHRLVW